MSSLDCRVLLTYLNGEFIVWGAGEPEVSTSTSIHDLTLLRGPPPDTRSAQRLDSLKVVLWSRRPFSAQMILRS